MGPAWLLIDQAIKIARASDGAHTIHDELTVKK